MSAEVKVKITSDTSGFKSGISDAEGMVGKLKNTLGAIAIGGTIAAIGKTIQEMAEKAEYLDKFSKRVVDSVESIQTLGKAVKAFDLELPDMDAALTGLTKKMAGVDDESSNVGKALKSIGLSLGEIKDKGPVERMKAIVVALSKVRDANRRAEIGMKLFGKGYGAIRDMVAAGPERIADAFDKAAKKSVVGAKSIEDLASLEDGVKSLQTALETAKMQLSASSAKAFADILEHAAETLDRMAKDGTFERWGEELGTIAKKAMDILDGLYRFFRGRSLWVTLLDIASLRFLMSSAKAIISRALDDAAAGFSGKIAAGVATASAVTVSAAPKTDKFQGLGGAGYGAIAEAPKKMESGFSGALGRIGTGFSSTFASAGKKVTGFVASAVSGFSALGRSIRTQFIGLLSSPMVWIAAFAAVRSYVEYVKSNIDELEDKIRKMARSAPLERFERAEKDIARLKETAEDAKAEYEQAQIAAAEAGEAGLDAILKQISALKDLQAEEKKVGDEIESNNDRRKRIAEEIKRNDKEMSELRKERIQAEADLQKRKTDEIKAKWKTAAQDLEALEDIPTEVLRQLAMGSGQAVAYLRQQGVERNWETGQSEFLKALVSGKYTGNMSDQQKAAYLQSYAQKLYAIRSQEERSNKAQARTYQPPEVAIAEKEAELLEERRKLMEEDAKLARSTDELTIKQAQYREQIAKTSRLLEEVISKLSESTDPDVVEKLKKIREAMMDDNGRLISGIQSLDEEIKKAADSIIDSAKKAAEAKAKMDALEKKTAEMIAEKEKEKKKEMANIKMSPEFLRGLKKIGLSPEEITTKEQAEKAQEAIDEIERIERNPEANRIAYVPGSGKVLSEEQKGKIKETTEKVRREIKEENKGKAEAEVAAGKRKEVTAVPNVTPESDRKAIYERQKSILEGIDAETGTMEIEGRTHKIPSVPTRDVTKFVSDLFGRKKTKEESEKGKESLEKKRPASETPEKEETKQPVKMIVSMSSASETPEKEETKQPVKMIVSMSSAAETPEKYGAVAMAGMQDNIGMAETNSLLYDISRKLDNTAIVRQYGGR